MSLENVTTEDYDDAFYLSNQVEQAKRRAVLAASDAGVARDRAASAEQAANEAAKRAERANATIGVDATEAKQAASEAVSAKTAAKESATQAHESATIANGVAGIAGNLSNRLTGVESMAGIGPSTPVDGQTANLIEQPDTLTKAALSAEISEKAVVLREAPLSPFRYGAVGDGATDDTAAIQGMVNALQSSKVAGIVGGEAYIPAGDYVISDTILLDKFAGIIRGAGVGNGNVSYGPGMTTNIRWTGPNTKPMLLAQDYRHLQLRDLRLQGNETSPPTYGIQSHVLSSMTQGHSSNLAIQNVVIGRFPWNSDGSNAGKVQRGIGFTGDNGNNDQWHVQDCFIRGADIGLYVPNTQSIWSHLQDTTMWECSTGVKTSAHMTGTNVRFQLCDTDWEINSSAQVTVHGGFSENSKRLVYVTTSTGRYVQYGGTWTLQAPLGANPFLVHDDATNGGGFILDGVNIQNQVIPHPKIQMRTKTSILNPGRLAIRECRTSMSPADFDISTIPAPGFATGRIMLNLDYNQYIGTRFLVRENQTYSGKAPVVMSGIGPVEGVLPADIGSLYLRNDGGAVDLTLWIKQTGSGSTGWKKLSEA